VICRATPNSGDCVRSRFASSPPAIPELDGAETISVRRLAYRFGELFGIEPILPSSESETALLNNALRLPSPVRLPKRWRWTRSLNGPRTGSPARRAIAKPTHFEVAGREILGHDELAQNCSQGAVDPGPSAALTAERKLDERRQRALTRYYLAAGAGALPLACTRRNSNPQSQRWPLTNRCSNSRWKNCGDAT